jgi:Yip1 domain
MNLVDRVKAILLTPRAEWPVIATEPGDVAYLFKNYVAILAAIPAIATFIGTALIGYNVPGLGTIRVSLFSGLLSAIIGYLLAFVVTYVVALIADALAPRFGGQQSFANALKLTVYSYTPGWLAGVFAIIPSLAFLGILGLYALYLFWTGAPVLMRVPPERATGYTAAVVVCGIVLGIVVAVIQAALIGIPR